MSSWLPPPTIKARKVAHVHVTYRGCEAQGGETPEAAEWTATSAGITSNSAEFSCKICWNPRRKHSGTASGGHTGE